MFLVRRELFGATVYDPQSLTYFFVDEQQHTALRAAANGTGTGHAWGAQAAVDISGGRFASTLAALAGGSTLRSRPSPAPLPADTLTAPIRVYLEVCLRCNAHCTYCLNDAGSARPGELSTAELLRTIDHMSRDGVFEVRLTGGEPTLRPDFHDLARAVRKSGMALSVNSNLLMNRERLDRLAALRPHLLITSLDASRAPHTRHRGKGYDTIVENVRRLRGAGVPLRLNCMLSGDTIAHVEPFIDEFAPLGCGFCFILTRPVGRAGTQFRPPPLSKLIPVVQTIEDRRRAHPELYFSTSFHVVMERELTLGGVHLTGCNAIQKSFNVNSDGTVLPCAFLYELSPEAFALGNVREHDYSVLPIWRESSRLRTLRRRSSATNLRCIGCPRFKRDCLGTCVFMEIYAERTGQPDPYCRLSTGTSTGGAR
jgi:radical SAM protein with 4Fe4S-binding SPASM domain